MLARTGGRVRCLGAAVGLVLLAVLAGGCAGGQQGLPSVQLLLLRCLASCPPS